jgi:hypothetical protein
MCTWLSSLLEEWAFALSSTIFKIWKPFPVNPNRQLIANSHPKWVQKKHSDTLLTQALTRIKPLKTLWHLPHFSTSMFFYRPDFCLSPLWSPHPRVLLFTSLTMTQLDFLRRNRWPTRRPVASRVALDLPFWAMRSASYRLIRMAIEMASEVGAFFLSSIFCLA